MNGIDVASQSLNMMWMMIFLQLEDNLNLMFIMWIIVTLLDYSDLCFMKVIILCHNTISQNSDWMFCLNTVTQIWSMFMTYPTGCKIMIMFENESNHHICFLLVIRYTSENYYRVRFNVFRNLMSCVIAIRKVRLFCPCVIVLTWKKCRKDDSVIVDYVGHYSVEDCSDAFLALMI